MAGEEAAQTTQAAEQDKNQSKDEDKNTNEENMKVETTSASASRYAYTSKATHNPDMAWQCLLIGLLLVCLVVCGVLIFR